jgi:two-component system, cell cycle sensor histidine kinase and response regulator CckA
VLKLSIAERFMGWGRRCDASMPNKQSSIILVVDDELFVLKLLSRVLQAEGYNVLVAGGAEQALTIFRNDFNISLVLTDIMMPGMDGVQLAQAILEISPSLPVLFVSGRCDLIPLEMKCGCVPKPFTANDLISQISECLNDPGSQQRAAAGS